MKYFIIFLFACIGFFFGVNMIGTILDLIFVIIMLGLFLIGLLGLIDGIRRKSEKFPTIMGSLILIAIGLLILLILM